MARKTYDIAVKTGEYTDREGKTKGRYQNVGALMQDDDGRNFIILQRWFNPAGIPSDRESIILSCFAPKGDRQNTPQGQQSQGGGNMPDDEIPFAPEWR